MQKMKADLKRLPVTKKTKYGAAISLMAILLGLAACNSSKSTGDQYEFRTEPSGLTEGSISYDPCVMVTKADAEAILGETVDPAKNEKTPVLGNKACAYVASSQSSMKMVHIFLHPLSLGAEHDMWNGTKEMWRKTGKEVQPVAGLGKDAFVDPSGTLQVLTPKCILVVSVNGFKADAEKADAEKAFAQKALSRM